MSSVAEGEGDAEKEDLNLTAEEKAALQKAADRETPFAEYADRILKEAN